MGWLPESRVGWWAVALAGLNVTNVLVILSTLALGAVDLPDTFSDNYGFSMWGLSVWAIAMACPVTGVVAITHRHDHSRMVQVEPGCCWSPP